GWNTRLENGQWVPTFRNAKYLLPEADVAHYEADPSESYTESVLPVIAAGQAERVAPDHAMDDAVSLMATPGHTPGHVSVRIRSRGVEAMITGDAIHSTAQCVHPGWHFRYDSDAERARLAELCEGIGLRCVESDHWARGGEGAESLATAVAEVADSGQADFKPLYPSDLPLVEKIRTVAREIYRADDIELAPAASRKLAAWQKTDASEYPVCVAKTQYSFSTDPALLGAPTGFKIPVRDVRLSAGAGFVVALAGEIMTMPGLPRTPAAEHIDIDDEGRIVGLS
ncbi:MAG: formate--tetrahydrofolate ligase, partial [Myxococcota bacterium]